MRIKIIAALLVFSTGLFAGTQIAETITLADGSLATGTVTISWPTFSFNGVTVPANTILVNVSHGAFSVNLTPNEQTPAGQPYYTVTYTFVHRNSAVEHWIVPETCAVLGIRQVRVTNWAVAVAPSQITSGGGTEGSIMRILSNGLWGASPPTGLGVLGPTTSSVGTLALWDAIDGSKLKVGPTLSGNGSKVVTLAGGTSTGNAALWDAAGNIIDGGAPGTGSGFLFVSSTPGSCTEGTSGPIYNTTTHVPQYCGPGNVYSAWTAAGSASGDLTGAFPNPTVAKINGTSLAGLTTGLLKNTTGTGVPSIAVLADLTALIGTGTTAVTRLSLATIAGTGSASDLTAGTLPLARMVGGGTLSGDLSGTFPAATVISLNGTSLSGLGTGLLKNTTGTGVPSIAGLSDVTALTGTGATAATNLGLSSVAGSGSATDITTGTLAIARMVGAGTMSGDLSGTFPSPTVAKVNGTSLAGLGTGLLKNTTGTGVPSIAGLSDVTGLTGTGATAATNLGLAAVSASGSATDLTAGTLALARMVGSGTMSGDLTGTFPSPVVAKVNGTSLSGLSTGLLKNTTGTGVPSIASLSDVTALTGTGATAATNLGLAAVAGTGSATDITSGTLNNARLSGGGTMSGDLSGTFPSPTVAKLNGTSLAGLSTGLLKNTTTTGVPSIAALADVTALTGTGATAATRLGLATIAGSGSASDLTTGTIPTATLPSGVTWPGNACPSGYYCVDSAHYTTLAAAWTACNTASLKACPIFIQLPFTVTTIPWTYDNTETMVPKILTTPGVLTTQVQLGIPHLGGFTGGGRAGVPSSTVGTGGTTIRPGSSFNVTWAVSGVALSSGTTYTYTTATNTLSTGDWVSVAGISPADYNFQRCSVTVLTSTTFTCDIGYNPAAYSSGGTAAPNKFLMYLGDTAAASAFGTRISEVTVDCAVNGNTPVQGCSGIEVAQAQEQSGLVHVNVVDYTGWGIWIHGTGTQNSSYLDFEANGCYSSLSGPCWIGGAPGNTAVNPTGIGTIPLEIDNTGALRSVGPATLNSVNVTSATESTLTCSAGTATFTATAAFDTWLGNSNWVNIASASVAGFNGSYKITTTGTTTFTYAFTGGSCPAGSASGAIARVTPVLDYVICAGTACSDGGPASTTLVTNNIVHMERAGTGLLITGAGAIVNSNGDNCSTSANTAVATCEQWASNLTRTPITTALWQQGNSSFLNAVSLSDLIHTLTYIGPVSSSINGELTGLVRGGTTPTAAELSGDATTSGSNAVTVTKLNGTSLAGLATGILKNTTGTGAPSIAGLSDVTNLTGTGQTAATNLGLVSSYLQFFCVGVAASSSTLIMPGPVSACTTTTTGPKYPLPAGRILKNLRVRSSANGSQAGSGVFTVLVNAATSTGLTCTVGNTVAICSDLTHTYTIGAGDVVYLNYTTQASELLANIAVTIEVQ